MHWLELLVGTGFLGLILAPIIHRRGNLERWLRLAQAILAQILAETPASRVPTTTTQQTALVETLAVKLQAAGVPRKYASGLAAEALRLEQRIPAPKD